MLVKVLAVIALEILMSFDQEKSSFDPLEYTSLLNNLLQLAGYTDGAQPCRDAIQLCTPKFRARLTLRFQTFLAGLNARSPLNRSTLLTPFCRMPNPKHFFEYRDWPQFAAYEDDLVLLYPDRTVNEGCLFFDQEREVACWIDHPLGFPPERSWLPLAHILRCWIQMWEVNKITPEYEPKDWDAWELLETLRAWDELVTAVEVRVSGTAVLDPPNREPLVCENMARRWMNQSF